MSQQQLPKLQDSPLPGINRYCKRTEDIILAMLILPILSPIMLVICIAIKLSSRGPVICRQWRNGLNGEPFEIYKFRTMTCCEDGYSFRQASKSDPRFTRFGILLRKASLDEMPQFINVLQGRMSIVGPRPHTVGMNREYHGLIPGYALRHRVKPGITGLAQVMGWRGPTETLGKMIKRVEHDKDYINRASLLLDLKIIILTIFTGAWWRDDV